MVLILAWNVNEGTIIPAQGTAASSAPLVTNTAPTAPTGVMGSNIPSDISGRSMGDIRKRWIKEAKEAHDAFKSLAGALVCFIIPVL